MTDILVATAVDVRPIASMLRALSFKPLALVEIEEMGIKFIVEEDQSVQAHAYLSASAFASWTFTSPYDDATPSVTVDEDEDEEEPRPAIKFSISLAVLLECLNIFGNATLGSGGSAWNHNRNAEQTSTFRRAAKEDPNEVGGGSGKTTSMRLSYAGSGEPLVLLLEEGGIVTRCELSTYVADELMDLPFNNDSRVQKVIMKSEWLRDALQDIGTGADKVTFSFSPAVNAPTPINRYAKAKRREDAGGGSAGMPTFRLESTGTLGSSEMDYPNIHDVLEAFECPEPISNSYSFKHIQLTQKALAASTKTSIRTDADGLVSFQFLIPMAKGKADNKIGFVEFVCVALEE